MIITNSKKQIYQDGIFSNMITRLSVTNAIQSIKAPSAKYMRYQADLEDFLDYCDVQNANGNEIVEGLPFTFWNLYKATYSEVQGNIAEFPLSGVEGLEVSLYADVSILAEEVPVGLPGRTYAKTIQVDSGEVDNEGVIIWVETPEVDEEGEQVYAVNTFDTWWHKTGQGKVMSVDDPSTKVILSCNLRNRALSMAQVMILLNYVGADATHNSQLLNKRERVALNEDVLFKIEEI